MEWLEYLRGAKVHLIRKRLKNQFNINNLAAPSKCGNQFGSLPKIRCRLNRETKIAEVTWWMFLNQLQI